MSFIFKPGIRNETSLLIGIAAATGAGKTFSALRLARGLAGPDGKVNVIDTEAGRALHYADKFKFDHGDLKPPFTPEAYQEAILAAEHAGAKAIVIDSFSHEWEGEGGLQEIQEAELERMCTDDRTGQIDKRKMERLTAPAWKKPKMRHKRLVNRLLQCRSHLIFCLRAEEKIRFVKIKDDRGFEKTAIENAGWVPITEKRFMYEMTVSMTMLPDEVRTLPDGKTQIIKRAGIPVPIKIQDQHRFAFPEGEHVSEKAGETLAQWARGNVAANHTPAAPSDGGSQPRSAADSDFPPDVELLDTARKKAEGGKDAFMFWVGTLSDEQKTLLRPSWKDFSSRW